MRYFKRDYEDCYYIFDSANVSEDEFDEKVGYDVFVDSLTGDEIVNLLNENEQLKFENNELKCALALDEVDYIIADGKKIDIPPYYEFEQRYDSIMHRREYDGYD